MTWPTVAHSDSANGILIPIGGALGIFNDKRTASRYALK